MTPLPRPNARPSLALSCVAAAALVAPAWTQAASGSAAPAAVTELREALSVTQMTLQELAVPESPGRAFAMDVDFGGRLEHVVVWPHSVRAPGFRLLVQEADGSIVEAEPARAATYRGEVVGLPGSVVAGSVLDGQFEGLARLAHGEVWSIQPASRYAAGFRRADHAVHAELDGLWPDGLCATDEVTGDGDDGESGAAMGSLGGGPIGKYVLEIACDADVQYYQSNGSSVSATQLDIENIINGTDAIYDADADTLLTIPTILVRTSEPDPYTTSSPSGLLDEFANHWQGAQGDIERDLAHLFTGRNLNGSVIGIASLGAVCSKSSGYGLSQSKFSGNFNFRVGLTAHEIGHNCSAQHCNGAGQCRIMCSGIGGCDGSVTSFAPISVNSILGQLSFSFCVDDTGVEPPEAPVITSIVPGVVPSVVPGNEQSVSIVGTDLTSVGEVLVDGKSLPGFPPRVTIQSAELITFAMPLVDQLGTVTVEVLGGDLGSDSTTIDVVAASPPALELGLGNDPETLLSILPLDFVVGGQPGNLIVLWASLDPAPSAFPGLFSLDIGGLTNLLLLAGATVEPKGWADLVLSPVINLPFETPIYFQGVEYDPLTGALPLESTNVRTGEWWF